MKKILLLLPILAVLVLTSCSTESYVSNFSRFVDRTDAQCQDYNMSKWEKSINQFRKYGITQFCQKKSKLSSSQIKEILRLDARYLAIASSQSAVQVEDLISDFKKMGPELIGGFLDDFLKRSGKK